MTDPDTTVTNWRSRAASAWAWCVAHKAVSVPVAAFVLGAILGKLF